MGGFPQSLQYYFGAAALAALQIQRRSFADDHAVGLPADPQFLGSDALEAFFVHAAADDQFSVKFGMIFFEQSGRHDCGAQIALHVARAAAVHAPADDLGRERIVSPFGAVGDVDVIHVAFEEQLFAAFAEHHAPRNVAVTVAFGGVEAEALHRVFDKIGDFVLVPGKTGTANHAANQFDQFVLPFFTHREKPP